MYHYYPSPKSFPPYPLTTICMQWYDDWFNYVKCKKCFIINLLLSEYLPLSSSRRERSLLCIYLRYISINVLCTLTYPHLSSRYAAASLTTAWSPFLFGTFHWPSAPWVVESIKDCALYVVRSVTLFPLFSPVNRLPAKAGRFAILDILSFFALTSFLRHSVPAIMVAGKCTKRTTSSGLYKE